MPLTPSEQQITTSILETLLTAVAQPPKTAATSGGPVNGVGGTGIGTGRGRKRLLSGMFLILLDKNDWKEYYDLIPSPRALHPIRDRLALLPSNPQAYSSPLEVYSDLSLVFWNAMFYNERGSQIAKDAEVLKRLLDAEWGKYAAPSPTQADGILQQPRSFSPPPGSAQKKYPEIEQERERGEKEEREREQREREREQREKEEREREIQRKKVAAAIPSVAPVVGGAPGTRGSVQPQIQIPAAVLGHVGTPGQLPITGLPLSIPVVVDSDSDSESTSSDDTESESETELNDEDEDKLLLKHMDNSLPKSSWPEEDDKEGWLLDGDHKTYLHLFNSIKYYTHSFPSPPPTSAEPHSNLNESGVTFTTKTTTRRMRLSSVLENLPDIHESARKADIEISLKGIESKLISSSSYVTPSAFDQDMMRLFERARKYWRPSSSTSTPIDDTRSDGEGYAKVLILQRLYQALTSSYAPDRPSPVSSPNSNLSSSSEFPSSNVKSKLRSTKAPPGISPTKGNLKEEKEEKERELEEIYKYESKTNFASLDVGPGSLRLLDDDHEVKGMRNVNPFESSLNLENEGINGAKREKNSFSSISYKGHTYRPGDWVHLSNGAPAPALSPDAVSSTNTQLDPMTTTQSQGEGAGGTEVCGEEGGVGSASRPIVAQIWEIWRTSVDANADICIVEGPNEGPNAIGEAERIEGTSRHEDVDEHVTERIYISALWFHRPSETYHSPQRVFWENEVFMGAHLSTHPLPDILEPICVQFAEDHVRGRPRSRVRVREAEKDRGGRSETKWYPGQPLYVCDSIYRCRIGTGARQQVQPQLAIQQSQETNKPKPKPKFRHLTQKHLDGYRFSEGPDFQISTAPKNALRGKARIRSLYTFERKIYPRRWTSPFLPALLPSSTSNNNFSTSAPGPGGLVPDRIRPHTTHTVTSGTKSKFKSRNKMGPTKGRLYTYTLDRDGKSVAVPATVPKQQPQTQTQSYTDGQQQNYNTPYQYGQYGQAITSTSAALPSTSSFTTTMTAPKIHRKGVDRTISVYAAATGSTTGGAGSSAAVNGKSSASGTKAQYDLQKLPSETTRHFARDPATGSLLWFSSPPVNSPGRSITVYTNTNSNSDSNTTTRMSTKNSSNVAIKRNPNCKGGGASEGLSVALIGQNSHTPGPRYSLAYLHWRAMKERKREGLGKRKWNEEADMNEDGKKGEEAMQVDGESSSGLGSTKKPRTDIIDVDVMDTSSPPTHPRTTMIETLRFVGMNGL